MEHDEFELANELFNRLKNYLISNNAVQVFELRDNNIWIYSPNLLKWYCWPHVTLNKKELLKDFLIGSNNFVSYFNTYKCSVDPVVKNLCKCIGEPSYLEELAIKMDLIGI